MYSYTKHSDLPCLLFLSHAVSFQVYHCDGLNRGMYMERVIQGKKLKMFRIFHVMLLSNLTLWQLKSWHVDRKMNAKKGK